MSKDLIVKASRTAFLAAAALLLSACSIAVSDSTAEPLETQIPATTEESVDSSTGSGEYIPYQSFSANSDEYANSNVILFFNASWCSTCQVARENFEASLNQIPSDMAIVVVDFDDSDELRKKYGVTVQHTFVYVDAVGNELKKWSGSTSIAELIDQIS